MKAKDKIEEEWTSTTKVIKVYQVIVVNKKYPALCRLGSCPYNRFNWCSLFETRLETNKPKETDDFRAQKGFSTRCKLCLDAQT